MNAPSSTREVAYLVEEDPAVVLTKTDTRKKWFLFVAATQPQHEQKSLDRQPREQESQHQGKKPCSSRQQCQDGADLGNNLPMCSRMLCLAAARPKCIYFPPWTEVQQAGDSGAGCVHSLVSSSVWKGGGLRRE